MWIFRDVVWVQTIILQNREYVFVASLNLLSLQMAEIQVPKNKITLNNINI